MTNPQIVCFDFDGTVVAHDYPRIGKEVPGAIEVLKELSEAGTLLILYTMRSDKRLAEAVAWCEERGIPLYGVNANPDQKSWTNSPKAYAHLYIDDAALGCPLSWELKFSDREFVNWEEVRRLLVAKDYLKEKIGT